MAAIEHHRDSQPLDDHVLKELGDLNIADIAGRGVAYVDRDEGLVDAAFPLDLGEQGGRATPVAGVMDIDMIAWVGLLRQMLERRDDVLVGWPPLRRLGRRSVTHIRRGQPDQAVFVQVEPLAKELFDELNIADAPTQIGIGSLRQAIGQVAVRRDEQGMKRGLLMVFRRHGYSSG